MRPRLPQKYLTLGITASVISIAFTRTMKEPGRIFYKFVIPGSPISIILWDPFIAERVFSTSQSNTSIERSRSEVMRREHIRTSPSYTTQPNNTMRSRRWLPVLKQETLSDRISDVFLRYDTGGMWIIFEKLRVSAA
jgi:hypothetical protein